MFINFPYMQLIRGRAQAKSQGKVTFIEVLSSVSNCFGRLLLFII